LVRQEVGRLLIEQLRDPRLGSLVTISHVDVSSDLQHATVRVTVLGDEAHQREAMDGLTAAAGYVRRELGRRLQLKRTPELRFVLDEAIREGDQVLALLDTIRDEETRSDG
jgi:ribosome-binding factor A